MIAKIIMYESRCDKCKKIFSYDPQDNSSSLFSSRTFLENSMNSHGWKYINGKLYCPECVNKVQGGEK